MHHRTCNNMQKKKSHKELFFPISMLLRDFCCLSYFLSPSYVLVVSGHLSPPPQSYLPLFSSSLGLFLFQGSSGCCLFLGFLHSFSFAVKPIGTIVGKVPFAQSGISAMKIRYLAYLETPLISIFFLVSLTSSSTKVCCIPCIELFIKFECLESGSLIKLFGQSLIDLN